MKLARWVIGISCAVGIGSVDSKVFAQPANQAAQQAEAQWNTIGTYCFGCHNEGVGAGNLFLTQLNAKSVPEHPEIFEKVVRKLRGRQMPPPGMLQPSQQEVDALIKLARGPRWTKAAQETPCRPRCRRASLNRNEVCQCREGPSGCGHRSQAQYLPPDIAVEGFNNIAAALTVSPAFLEQYINAGRKVMPACPHGSP